MPDTPELYWKNERKEPLPGGSRFEFITKEQAATRGLLRQVLAVGEEAAYVRINPQTYELYSTWKLKNRRKR